MPWRGCTSRDRVRRTEVGELGEVGKINRDAHQPTTVRHRGHVEQHWADGTVRRSEAKAHVFTKGDAKTHVYKIASGAVCLYTVLTDIARSLSLRYLEMSLGWAQLQSKPAMRKQSFQPKYSVFPLRLC